VRLLDFTPHVARRNALASDEGEEGYKDEEEADGDGVGESRTRTAQNAGVQTDVDEDQVIHDLEEAIAIYEDDGIIDDGVNQEFLDQLLDGIEWETESEDEEEILQEEIGKPILVTQNVLSSSTIRKGPVFIDDVHSSLPYRAITKSVPHRWFSGVMLDDERIICLSSDGVFWVHTL